MANLPPTILETLMKQISLMPLWIRQVMYAQLKLDLEHTLSTQTLEAFSQEHMLQLWVPELSKDGIAMITSASGDRNAPLMRLLHLTRFKKDVANITVMNNWSLEQCSLYLKEAVERNLINRPTSGVILATIEYLAGVTRLGEYLVKINRVTEEQLDQSLRTQKYIEESMGEKTGIANVMINLGYIKKEDTEGVLFLKEESRKPFQMAEGGLQPTPSTPQAGLANRAPGLSGAAPSSPPPNFSGQPPQTAPTQTSQGFPPQQANRPPQAGFPAPPPQASSQQTPAPPETGDKSKKWGLF
ncbi:MAG: hypothetical protein VKJ04_09610 [Vampirovibrionales bacterium]|nr:hypothetical protein [Vampirovibrionales bacterium]